MEEKSVDDIIDEVLAVPNRREMGDDRTPVTFWLPKEYKEKYKVLQNRTNRKLSKAIREVLKHSIDRLYNQTPEAS